MLKFLSEHTSLRNGLVRSALVGLLLPLPAALAQTGASTDQTDLPRPPASAAPVDDGQWTMPAKNFTRNRYSELAELTPENVRNLPVAFTFSVGVNRGQEASPLVVGGTMCRCSGW